MISTIDIWRVAHLIVKGYGEDSTLHAGMRVDELLAEGDVEGAAIWRAIIHAIDELQRARREDDPVQ